MTDTPSLDDDDALRLIDLDLPGDVGSDDPSVSASDGTKTSGFQGDADSMSRHHLDGSVNEASATIASDDQHQHQPRQRPPRRARRQQQQQQQRPARLMAEPRESALSSPFGGRQLDDSDRVFEHNAWDNVAWTPERAASAAAKEAVQRARPAAAGAREAAEAEAAARWDRFYASHRDRFFKDRRWLRQEFPELFEHEGDGVVAPEASAVEGGVGAAPTRAPLAGIYPEGTRHVVFEVGCGAGNTVFPLIEADPSVFVYAADFSAEAVELVKSHPQFDARRICPLVFDITAADPAAALPPGALGTVDTVVCVFVLSALDPSTWPSAARNLRLLLRPGGRVLFRDYGRHDLAQLRLPAGRLLTDGLYTRGDGTRVYFFEEDDLDRLFDGLVRESVAVDRRLLVNRARKLEMYRVWIQAKYRRPVGDE